ncbi:MAG: nickel pincer cofactor biosynthesis protein LarC [Gemmataceae bacterium]|nr:nickel pincer cofactor biosynthesis protein LarC [Gemmataceae bacterium]MDW8266950.1 nickel pincer cofactor biosynthesis protein LarC [Gemmataceae bacterium]
MRVVHFDCFSGISGDMTLAALIDAGVDADVIRQGIDSLGLPIRLEIDKVRKGGFAATAVRIEGPTEGGHRFLRDVEEILGRANLTAPQRHLALRIFRRLAEAEAAVHGLPVDRVHFHEVGALDSIADIVGAAIGLDLLGAARITSGPVPTGSGMVRCAHGLMPIPAPGTAELLKGVPLAPSSIKAELTTPTGAAILTTVVHEWVDQPVMTIERIGHGAGRRELLEQPNLLRLFVGTTGAISSRSPSGYETDTVWLLETNLDDAPGDMIGYCFDRLLAAGALDVFATPIQMKKHRPGVMLSVLASGDRVEALEAIIFRETTTLGVRRMFVQRHKLHRETAEVATPWGVVRGKLARRPGESPRFSPEYDDCARIAREQGIPLWEVYAEVRRLWTPGDTG